MNKIQVLRETHKPDTIKYLLIAESPPASRYGEFRFFYNPKVQAYDYLFKSVMEIIFKDFKETYKKSKKELYLKEFQKAGFYLIDATDTPVNRLDNNERNELIGKGVNDKIKEIEQLIEKDTPIFLIKKNIFEIYYPRLKEMGYNIAHDEFLAFPSTGNQKRFKEGFSKALNENQFNEKIEVEKEIEEAGFKVNNVGMTVLVILGIISYFLFDNIYDDVMKMIHGYNLLIEMAITFSLWLSYTVFFLIGAILFQSQVYVFKLSGCLFGAIGGGIFIHLMLNVAFPFVFGVMFPVKPF